MIYFFRGITLFCILNLIPLILFGGSGGMIPVWILLALISAVLSCRRIYKFFFKRKWIKGLFWISVIIFVIIEGSIVTVGFTNSKDAQSDYLIVLGAQVRGNVPSATLKYRLDAAYQYLCEYPEAKVVVSGGQGPDEIMTEALAMSNYLTQLGIAPERILLEDKSHTTRENLTNSFAIIENEKQDATISLVSNRFHLLRAKMQAKELGRSVGLVDAKSYLYLIPNYYFREFFAVIKEIFIYMKVAL